MTDFTLHEGFPNIQLPSGVSLRLIAIDPTTGNSVAGVTASTWAIYGDNVADAVVVPFPQLPILTIPLGGTGVA